MYGGIFSYKLLIPLSTITVSRTSSTKTLSENKEMREKMSQIDLNINRKSVFF